MAKETIYDRNTNTITIIQHDTLEDAKLAVLSVLRDNAQTIIDNLYPIHKQINLLTEINDGTAEELAERQLLVSTIKRIRSAHKTKKAEVALAKDIASVDKISTRIV